MLNATNRVQALNRRFAITALFGALAAPRALAQDRRGPSAERRLDELGIELPPPPRPVAAYAAYRRAGRLLYLAGLGPAHTDAALALGRVGADLSVAQGRAAARAVGLNVLSLLRSACGGSLNRVAQCVHLGVFVSSADDFHDQPAVADGASELFVEVFGEAGLGARFAVGVNTLPFNIAVEVESVWELRR